MKKKVLLLFVSALLVVMPVSAQEAEVKVTLDEAFFEALLEGIFNHLDPPKVPLTLSKTERDQRSAPSAKFTYAAFSDSRADCDESVRLKKEEDGVKTSVRFRGGKIYAPIAFEGSYEAPLIGCMEFAGFAETRIDLLFDQPKNTLFGNAKVLNVNLTGTEGVGSPIVTRLVQAAIDRKINPLKIFELAQLSFTAPIQNSGKLRLEAAGFRHVVGDRQLDLFIKYRFRKG